MDSINNNTVKEYISAVKEVMLATVKKMPSSDGEAVVEDALMFTPDGYFVIKRVTDNGVVYYTNREYNLLPEIEARPSVRAIGVITAVIAKTVLVNVASELFSAIGSYACTSILGAIFGTNQSVSMEELNKEMRNIVKDETVKNTIAEKDGEINGIQQSITGLYQYRKDAGEDKRLLLMYLESFKLKLDQIIGILSQERFSKTGLATFIYGANVMLALLLEMAFLEEDINKTNLEKTPCKQTYNKNVKNYAEHVYMTKDKVLSGKDAKTRKEMDWMNEVAVGWLKTVLTSYNIEVIDIKRNFDICGNKKDELVNLIHYPPHKKSNQMFLLLPVSNDAKEKNHYYILSCLSGKALDVTGRSTSDGAEITQWNLVYGAANQTFILTTEKNSITGYLKITAKHSGKTIVAVKINEKTKSGTNTIIQMADNKVKDYHSNFILREVFIKK